MNKQSEAIFNKTLKYINDTISNINLLKYKDKYNYNQLSPINQVEEITENNKNNINKPIKTNKTNKTNNKPFININNKPLINEKLKEKIKNNKIDLLKDFNNIKDLTQINLIFKELKKEIYKILTFYLYGNQDNIILLNAIKADIITGDKKDLTKNIKYKNCLNILNIILYLYNLYGLIYSNYKHLTDFKEDLNEYIYELTKRPFKINYFGFYFNDGLKLLLSYIDELQTL